jgi:hypothetical protein
LHIRITYVEDDGRTGSADACISIVKSYSMVGITDCTNLRKMKRYCTRDEHTAYT